MFAMGVILYRCIIGRMPKRKPNGTVNITFAECTHLKILDHIIAWSATQTFQ